MTDPRPANCVFRLRAEDKPYPRTGCRGCQQQMLVGQNNGYCTQHPASPAEPPADRPASHPAAPDPVPHHGTAPSNMAEFEVNHGATPRTTRND